MRLVPMREFYKNMKKFQDPAVVGSGIIVTSKKIPVFVVTKPLAVGPFTRKGLERLQTKGLPKDLSLRVDEIVYGKF